ncbi:flagellar FliJ protein [Peptococcaceae bacterium CEB3]|nr:flagellar FliJ protein [Peptococcaceae bacterium CEB3]
MWAMAQFKFRLETSLGLAENALEEAQRRLAEEVLRWQTLMLRRERQERRWLEGLNGQRRAQPEELGRWQVFARQEYRKLQTCETELQEQEKRKEEQRRRVVESYRRKEKFRRLKGRQSRAWALAEQRREQKVLDEAGQIIYLSRRVRGGL